MGPIRAHSFSAKLKESFLVFLTTTLTLAGALAAESCQSVFTTRPTYELQSLAEADPYHLPVSAILIALGLDTTGKTPLREFAVALESALQRKVVTYRNFEQAGYTDKTGKWWHASPAETTAIVEQAIRRAVEMYPGKKIIAFRLDGIHPRQLTDPNGREIFSYTNFEIRLLLKEPKLYAATRWYLEGRELREQEAKAFWSPALKAQN